MRADAPRAKVFCSHTRKKAGTTDHLTVIDIFLTIDVKPGLLIPHQYLLFNPLLERGGGTGVAVVILCIFGVLLLKNQAHNVERILFIKRVLLLRRDHIIRRRCYLIGWAGFFLIEQQTCKGGNVYHGNLPGIRC